MKPALSQVCSLNSPFETDLADYAAGNCSAIEIWLTKLENYLKSHTTDEVRRRLDERQLTAPVAAFQGGLLASQGEQRREAWALFSRRLQLCRELGIETLIVACDVPTPLSQTDIDRVRVSLRQAGDEAAQFGRRLAVEFQSRSALGNNLQTAAYLIREAASPHVGLCLDAFHYYVGPSKPDDLGYLTRENLFHVQLCDLADVPRELATDSDRILPGDGDIPLAPLLARLREIGYDRHVSIELLNPQIWQIPALQFGEVAMQALRRLLPSDAKRAPLSPLRGEGLGVRG